MILKASWRDLDPKAQAIARKYFETVERSAEQKRKDLVLAFDEIHDLKCTVRSLKNWGKVQMLALTCAGALILWLADHLYACVQLAAQIAAK